jgi:hypothetical protein
VPTAARDRPVLSQPAAARTPPHRRSYPPAYEPTPRPAAPSTHMRPAINHPACNDRSYQSPDTPTQHRRTLQPRQCRQGLCRMPRQAATYGLRSAPCASVRWLPSAAVAPHTLRPPPNRTSRSIDHTEKTMKTCAARTFFTGIKRVPPPCDHL